MCVCVRVYLLSMWSLVFLRAIHTSLLLLEKRILVPLSASSVAREYQMKLERIDIGVNYLSIESFATNVPFSLSSLLVSLSVYSLCSLLALIRFCNYLIARNSHEGSEDDRANARVCIEFLFRARRFFFFLASLLFYLPANLYLWRDEKRADSQRRARLARAMIHAGLTGDRVYLGFFMYEPPSSTPHEILL